MWRCLSTFGSALLLALVASCSSDPAASPNPDEVPAACRDIAVDPFKELMIVDEAVIGSPRSSNAQNGPWSYRHIVEELTTPGKQPSDMVTSWLALYRAPATVNVFNVPARDIKLVESVISCPWLKRTPANGCNDDCSQCTSKTYDLAQAPFRLLAISNRVDVRETAADLGGTGEGRLVFGLMNGAADDPKSTPLRMSIIFEFHLPDAGGSAAVWAGRWHDLAKHSAFDEGFMNDLASLTESFVRRNAAPDRPFGSALAQMRTNERELDWQWDLREFKLSAGTGAFALEPLFNTPDRFLNGSARLSDWAKANRDSVLKNQHTVPPGFLGGFSQPTAPWVITGGDEPLRKALATQTCDGCHQSEQTPVDINFHVTPFKSGIAKLSPFLWAPSEPIDELRRRSVSMRRALCSD